MAGTFGLQDVRGYDALTPRKYSTTCRQSICRLLICSPNPSSGGITRETLSYRDTVARPTARWGPAFTEYLKRVFYWNEQITRLDRPQLLDLLNMKYYLVARGARPPAGAEDYKLVYSKEIDVYENPRALPRAFVVPSWKFVADEKVALDEIRDPGFDPRARLHLLCIGRCWNSIRQRCHLSRSRNPEVRTERSCNSRTGPGVLVLTDSYFPGWRAEGFDIYEANYLFRGVLLKDGPQTLTFSFHPFG